MKKLELNSKFYYFFILILLCLTTIKNQGFYPLDQNIFENPNTEVIEQLFPKEMNITVQASGLSTSNTWTNMNPLGSKPTDRYRQAMTYDASHEVTILYGGYPFKGDTWVYNLTSNTWTNMFPQGSTPGERWGSAMVYDTVHEVAILFGGSSDLGPKDDTWVYNLSSNKWTKMNCTTKPSARSGHSMVYDLTYHVTILFDGGMASEGYKDDTWVYNLTSNIWTDMNPQGNKPDIRSLYGMIYDVVNELTVIFGGFDSNEFKGDTWIYNLTSNTWTDMNPQGNIPIARANLGMMYDVIHEVTIIFGGSSDLGLRDDTWKYNLSSNTWTEMNPQGGKPSARWGSGMVYDITQEVAILFGGSSGSPLAMDDTWVYNLKNLGVPILNQIIPSTSVTGVINLLWNDVPYATFYEIYRDTSYIIDTSILTPIATIAETQFQDTLYSNGTCYYAIVAIDVPFWRSTSNCESVEVTIDSLPPSIMINTPYENQLFGSTPPDFSIEIIDEYLNLTWYSLDGVSTNITFSGLTGTIDQSEWNKLGNGTVTITFYANDTLNNIGQAEVTVRKDIETPTISINSPVLSNLYGYVAPSFDLTILDPDLTNRWYSLDGGSSMIPFIGFTGTIDQSEWNKLGNGTVTITFYASDIVNNIGQAEVTVRKDIIGPIITILSPIAAEKFEYSPIFEIIINGDDLDEYWYTTDNGANNYSITSLTGSINQTAWDAAPNGPVTIQFFAGDKLGNINTNFVVVNKVIHQITGFDLAVLIGVTSIFTIFMIKWNDIKKKAKT